VLSNTKGSTVQRRCSSLRREKSGAFKARKGIPADQGRVSGPLQTPGAVQGVGSDILRPRAAAGDQAKRDCRGHRLWPLPDRTGRQTTELATPAPLMAMTCTKYPQACKALMAFMIEVDQ
jgi:hypothetical protein